MSQKTGLIDYEKLEEAAKFYNPKIIIAGASAYARLIDYERIVKIADECGAYVLADMAHPSGLIATKSSLYYTARLQLCFLCYDLSSSSSLLLRTVSLFKSAAFNIMNDSKLTLRQYTSAQQKNHGIL